jgi:hypothetical protein
MATAGRALVFFSMATSRPMLPLSLDQGHRLEAGRSHVPIEGSQGNPNY